MEFTNIIKGILTCLIIVAFPVLKFAATSIMGGALWDELKYQIHNRGFAQKLCHFILSVFGHMITKDIRQEILSETLAEVEFLLSEQRVMIAVFQSFGVLLNAHGFRQLVHVFRRVRTITKENEVSSLKGLTDKNVIRNTRLSTLASAAEKISFSTPLLRSYGKVYESLGGRITHDSQGTKIYGDDLLERFQQVRQQVHEGHPIQTAMKSVFEFDKDKR